jgi:hypothetical protein
LALEKSKVGDVTNIEEQAIEMTIPKQKRMSVFP